MSWSMVHVDVSAHFSKDAELFIRHSHFDLISLSVLYFSTSRICCPLNMFLLWTQLGRRCGIKYVQQCSIEMFRLPNKIILNGLRYTSNWIASQHCYNRTVKYPRSASSTFALPSTNKNPLLLPPLRTQGRSCAI